MECVSFKVDVRLLESKISVHNKVCCHSYDSPRNHGDTVHEKVLYMLPYQRRENFVHQKDWPRLIFVLALCGHRNILVAKIS